MTVDVVLLSPEAQWTLAYVGALLWFVIVGFLWK